MSTDTTTYPNLGFNPVPGVPDNVERMESKISIAVDSLRESNYLMSRLRDANDSIWQGDAGNAFRDHVDEKLVKNLDHAQTSLEKAVGVLSRWHGDLVNFKGVAAQLDQEMAAAKQQQAQARDEYNSARSNHDLNLAQQWFGDPVALQQAQTRLDAAKAELNMAAADFDAANANVDDIMRRAKELEQQHHQTGMRAAAELAAATDHLAPHKPGGLFHAIGSAFSAIGGFIGDHIKDIHNVLSTISSVAGLVALVTPPPIDAIALGVSVATGAAAFATDLADPNFRHQMGRLMTFHFDKDSLGALATGVGDGLSMVPGVKVLAAEGKVASTLGKVPVLGKVVSPVLKSVRAAEAAGEGLTGMARISEIASTVAHQPSLLAKGLSKIPHVGTALEAARLIPKGAGEFTMINQNMLTILLKGRGVGSHIYSDVTQ
jgi:hypothetical protein